MATGPAVTLKRLWRQNRWLAIAFALTLTLALVFIIRAGVFLSIGSSIRTNRSKAG
jgi:Na+/alanine symporter